MRGKETFLLAETLHAPGGANSRQPLPALRLIVTQKLTGQLELPQGLGEVRDQGSALPPAVPGGQAGQARGPDGPEVVARLRPLLGLRAGEMGRPFAACRRLRIVAQASVKGFAHLWIAGITVPGHSCWVAAKKQSAICVVTALGVPGRTT